MTGEDKKYDHDVTPPPSYEEVQMKNVVKTDKKDEKTEDEKEKDGEEKTEELVPPVGMLELFKFSTAQDKFLIIFGLLIAFSMGVSMPILCILFGQVLQAFVERKALDDIKDKLAMGALNVTNMGNATVMFDPASLPEDNLMVVVRRFGIGMIGLALTIWFLSWLFVTCLNVAAARQVFNIRCKFLAAVLKQDIAWYDTNTANDFASRLTEDLNKLQEGIGEKLGMLAFFVGTFFLSIITALIYGWDLTLVIMTMIPFMAFFGGIAAKVQSTFAEKEMAAYGKAGSIAEESLSAIRTVVAFGGQEKEVQRYGDNLKGAKKSGILRGMLTGVSGGLIFGIMYCVYALGFWYGIKSIMDDRESEECQMCGEGDLECFKECSRYSPGALLVVFFSVLIGGFQIGQSAPYAEALATSRSAAGRVYQVIARVPGIDSSSKEGRKPARLEGNIKFEAVHFNYPSRQDVKILQGLTLEVPKGKTVALVGSSGCGKSTCIQLVQRFYDPHSGTVKIDGVDIKDLNIGWLRDHIGVVGQEPVLFDMTITENIRLGKQDATDEEIEKACKEANAYNFIMKLPQKYNTMVGEGGTQLSGGQKQRIAIARALVRNPQILLLDEATSALDTESEKVVQTALDQASAGRTTIVVAHRLSTIRSAHLIMAIDKGSVKEVGTHDQLMEKKDLYYSLVTRQLAQKEEKENSPEKIYPDLSNGKTEDNISEINMEEEGSAVGKFVRSSSRRLSRQMSAVKMGRERTQSEKKTETEEADEDLPKIPMMRILKRNRPEYIYIFIGVLASSLMGSVMPLFGIIFGDTLGVLGDEDPDEARANTVKYALMFVGLGFYAFFTQFIQGLMFSISGENLTNRMRKDAFQAMLRQEMGWYDRKENNTGALCARLSGDCAKVQGATGARVGSVVQGIAGVIFAIVLGLIWNWKLGLVCSLFFPLTILAVIVEQRIIIGVDSIEKLAFEQSAKLAIEAITNIRTIAGLRCEEKYVNMYVDLLAVPHKATMRNSHKRGFIFGFSQGIQYFAWGLTLWYGGYLVDIGDATYQQVFTVQNAIIGGAGMVGYSFAFVADFHKAMLAAARVFKLLDRKPEIDTNPATGLKLGEVKGNVDLMEAEFSYPTRPNIRILKRLQLSIKSGESIALVGESGCGKSTVIQLIQRLYDLESGDLHVEKNNIQALNLPWLRSKLGLVSQEPVLFDRTIADNIKYGDNEREVSMEEVLEAARKANIHSFVSSLPGGYDTKVGAKGTQLSGGQKQRVAIARALVRNPKVLLLDEATSALDTESEKVVQDALDAAQIGRTSITIAHRLSTIKNVNQIYIIDNGQIVEHGTHDQLLESQGFYYKLWNNSVH